MCSTNSIYHRVLLRIALFGGATIPVTVLATGDSTNYFSHLETDTVIISILLANTVLLAGSAA